MSRRKTVVNHARRPGMIRYGMEIPMGAVYGTLTIQNDKTQPKVELPWVCIDPNFYPDGRSIDILVYNARLEKWIMKCYSCGKIYSVLVKYMEENNLVGTQPKYALRYNGTFQKYSPTGKKQKGTALKEANKIHWKRGDKPGVRLGYNGAPYTTNGAFGTPMMYI